MAEREKGNLPASRAKVRIGSHGQGLGLLLHGSDNGAFDLAFSPGLENDHLQPEAAHRGLRLLDVIPRQTRIVRIHKDRNPGRGGKELMQQLQPLGNKLGSDKSDPRDVSLWTTQTRHETRGHRVGGRHEHDRDRLRCRHHRPDSDVRRAVLMAATLRLTRSAAMEGSRSNWPSAQRYSMATLRPSAQPASPRPRWNPAMRSVHCAADTPCSTPITGIAGCCAPAPSGNVAAAPPSSVMNSRLFMSDMGLPPARSDHQQPTDLLYAQPDAEWRGSLVGKLMLSIDLDAACPSMRLNQTNIPHDARSMSCEEGCTTHAHAVALQLISAHCGLTATRTPEFCRQKHI